MNATPDQAPKISPPNINAPSWAIYNAVEDELGYGDYLETCRGAFARAPGEPVAPFHSDGFELMNLMSRTRAERLLEHIQKAEKDPANLHHPNDEIHLIVMKRREIARLIISTMLTREVDRRLTAFFGSEYRVKWMHAQNVSVCESPGISFCWHRDVGPQRHVKLMLYLTDTAVCGGNTAFLDLKTTRKLEEAGYGFVGVDERFTDLTRFAAERGIAYEPAVMDLKCGDAILFQPTNVLHCGVKPTDAPRYSVTLCIDPYDKPWQAYFDAYPVEEFQDTGTIPWARGRPWAGEPPRDSTTDVKM